MATQMFFLDTVATTHRADKTTNLAGTATWWVPKKLSTSRGTGLVSQTVTSALGPTSGIEAGSTPVEWLSEPLAADVTISGTITCNLWGNESSMNANAAPNVAIDKVDGATGALTRIATSTFGTELPLTTSVAHNFTVSPTSTACKRGDRLRVRVFYDDATATTMASGFTLSFGYGLGSAAANGDSYVTFTETITFETTTPAGSTYYLTSSTDSSITNTGVADGDTGLLSATTAADNSVIGTDAWVNPTNAITSNDTRATVPGTGTSHLLDTSGHTISIPSDVGLTGVLVEIEGQTTGGTGTIQAIILLSNVNQSSKNVVGGWGSIGTGDTTQNAGSNGDIWTNNLHKLQFTSGAHVCVQTQSAFVCGIDNVRLRLYYKAPVARTATTARGGGATTAVTGAGRGPVDPIAITPAAGSAPLEWYTPALDAFTLGGMAKFNIRAFQSAAGADASLRAEIAVCNDDGSGATVWGTACIEAITTNGDSGELPTAEAAASAWVAGDDKSVTQGQKLRFRIYADDPANNFMSHTTSSQTVSVVYAGTSGGATGDTFVTLPQTVTEATGVAKTIRIRHPAPGEAVMRSFVR